MFKMIDFVSDKNLYGQNILNMLLFQLLMLFMIATMYEPLSHWFLF